MSQAPNASFFIVNKSTTSDGRLLAATYTGQGNAVIVTEFANLDSQVWILAPYNETTQIISPKNASSLLAGTEGDGILKSLSDGRHNWVLQGALGTYTIVDAGIVNYWYIGEAAVGQNIAKGPKSSARLSDWQLILV